MNVNGERELQQARSTARKDRKEIYLGESIRKALIGRRDSLTTIVNLLIERYLGIVERHFTATLNREDDVLLAVMREYRRPLTSADIATFPARVRDYCERHPDVAPDGGGTEHYGTLLAAVERASFPQLVALIDRVERKL